MKLRLGLAILVVFCLPSLWPVHAREWTDNSGTHKIEADLVKLDDQLVVLKKSDGKVLSVPLTRLSDADHRFLAEPFFRQGVVAYNKNDLDLAISWYTEAIRVDSAYAAAHGSRGFAYNVKGEKEKAIADFTEAIRLKPDYALAYCQRGIVYLTNNDLDKAIADLTEAIRLKPDYTEAYENRRLAYEQKTEKRMASTESQSRAASDQSTEPTQRQEATQPFRYPVDRPHSAMWHYVNDMSINSGHKAVGCLTAAAVGVESQRRRERTRRVLNPYVSNRRSGPRQANTLRLPRMIPNCVSTRTL